MHEAGGAEDRSLRGRLLGILGLDRGRW